MTLMFPLQVLSENEPQVAPRHLLKVRILAGLQLVYRNHWGLALPQRDQNQIQMMGAKVSELLFEVQPHVSHSIWESGSWAILSH